MKKNMPTTRLLLGFSWMFVVLSGVLCLYTGIVWSFNVNSILIISLILFVGLLLAAILRMIANIGQLIFDLNVKQEKNIESIADQIQRSNESIADQIQLFHKNLTGNLLGLKGVNEQINCDSKDINQNIREINEFLLKLKHHVETLQ